jgi:putative sigma-54 modulation protein
VRAHKGAGAKTGDDQFDKTSEADVEDAAGTRIAEIRKIILKPMSHDDAIMELEASRNLFIIFRDAATENVAVIYRRDDGNYVLIETKSQASGKIK